MKKAYCHILLDGRDVPATSALEYVEQLETVLAALSGEHRLAEFGRRKTKFACYPERSEESPGAGVYGRCAVGVVAFDDPIGTAIDADRRGVQGAAPYNSEA